jgi:hypothetical protein
MRDFVTYSVCNHFKMMYSKKCWWGIYQIRGRIRVYEINAYKSLRRKQKWRGKSEVGRLVLSKVLEVQKICSGLDASAIGYRSVAVSCKQVNELRKQSNVRNVLTI